MTSADAEVELGFANNRRDADRLAEELGGRVVRVADRRGWAVRDARGRCSICGAYAATGDRSQSSASVEDPLPGGASDDGQRRPPVLRGRA